MARFRSELMAGDLPGSGTIFPSMACTALAPELESHGLTRCYYVVLYCQQHGKIRTAIQEEPRSRYPCPLCGVTCDCTLLARGGTRRALPCWDVISPPLRTSSGVAVMSEEPYFPPLVTHVMHWPK